MIGKQRKSNPMNLQNAGATKKNANAAQKLPNMLRFSYSFLFLQHYSHAQAQNQTSATPPAN